MSTPSITHQVKLALSCLWVPDETKREIRHQYGSVKFRFRTGPVTQPLSGILSYRTYNNYFDSSRRFLTLTRELTGEKLLVRLLAPELVVGVFTEWFSERAVNTRKSYWCALAAVERGALALGWLSDLRLNPDIYPAAVYQGRIAGFENFRGGYTDADADALLARMQELYPERGGFGDAVALMLSAGLRRDEVTFAKGSWLLGDGRMQVKGKGGRVRVLEIPPDLYARLNPSQTYLFGATRAWARGLYNAVHRECRWLEIGITGLHRFRATYAQREYSRQVELFRKQDCQNSAYGAAPDKLMANADRHARQIVSNLLGHNRLDVTKRYVPENIEMLDTST
ncbi:MAG: site-specific integrase [Anaerolineae bacterium]|nr:MAG: site-specific integrase [Anaerolineae bacterium]